MTTDINESEQQNKKLEELKSFIAPGKTYTGDDIRNWIANCIVFLQK